jgi:hypothetical protein
MSATDSRDPDSENEKFAVRSHRLVALRGPCPNAHEPEPVEIKLPAKDLSGDINFIRQHARARSSFGYHRLPYEALAGVAEGTISPGLPVKCELTAVLAVLGLRL